jgi:hypothetical protein
MPDYKQMFQITKEKIFDDIFNYSDITLKNNIHLALMNNGKPVRSMLYSALLTIMMPDTTNTYYLYICENPIISNLLYSLKSWGNLEDVLNDKKVNIDLITSEHKMIPKRLVQCILDNGGMTIFAIDKNAFKKINGTNDVYITINVDTDLVGDRTVISHIPGYNNNINTLMNTFDNSNVTRCIGFINGYVIRNDLFKTYGDLSADTYELYVDGNIQYSFIVDLANRKTYHSSEENLYKDIILIPRDLIQDNVCTYDTVSLIVRTYDGKGIFVPFLASTSVSQLTHTSMGISSFVIDAALDKLGVTSGELLVIVSNYSKTNKHVENGSLTEQLYTLEDDSVMTLLDGSGTYDVGYWLADSMEKRMYGKYLTEIEEMDEYDQGLISHQIECLGYYPFVKLLCTHNTDITNLESPLNAITLKKPPFWKGVDLFPIFHLDGNKLSQDNYTITNTDEHVEVSFDTPVPVDFSWSVFNYEFILKPNDSTYKANPVAGDNLVIPKRSGNLHVFIKTDNTSINIDDSSHATYEELYVENNSYYSVVDYENQYIFTFKTTAQDNEFIFEWDSVTNINVYPNVDIEDGHTMFFIPYTKVVGSVESVSSLVDNDYEVYLNDRFMVKDIDYCINPLKYDDEIAGFSIVVQNLKFLNDNGENKVDVFITNRKIITADTGYIVDGIIPRNTNNEAWIQGVSRLFINGKLVPFSSVTVTPTHFEIDSRYTSNGYVYHFVNSVSNDFYKAYESFMDSQYFTGRSEVSNYFTKDYTYNYPEQIIISYGNKIFSSYLNEIIRRIINNEITVRYVNNDQDILDQLSHLEYLKDFDVFLRDDNKVNLRFVDVYPGYLSQLTVDDFNRYLYIQRLVKILLGTDAITDHLTVYEG